MKMATEARGEGLLSPERAQNPTSRARIPALPAGGEGRWRRAPTRAHRLPWARGHGAPFPLPPPPLFSSPTLHGQDGEAETKQVLQRHVSPAGRREQGPPRPHL